ncbi:hypothetical protein PQX77_002846 [Marasmius sp. AFHP31]|nr:hypothetical protein PQX77_003145 [Marasmius sp. AFHP31]KAK1233693.1 hypothetical protein PQX77_003143 [Marasmius sp. AFHP31]KAK1233963.1 hypothetical protein PQX77_002846 [Marasmius sp. AFHP31]
MPTEIPLTVLYRFVADPTLQAQLSLDKLLSLIELLRLLKPSLLFLNSTGPPSSLPANIHDFLISSLRIPHEVSKIAWGLCRDVIWEMGALSERDERGLRLKHARVLVKNGISNGIGVYNLEPPFQTCINPACCHPRRGEESILVERSLIMPIKHEITVFTKEIGPVPGFAVSRYCRNCHTRYHHNYYLHSNATIRTYYKDTPSIIQTSQHYYVSQDLLQLFRTIMVTAWTSFTNCARIYNEGLAQNIPDLASLLPLDWPISTKITLEIVSDGFYLYSLILDHAERSVLLRLDNTGQHQSRLNKALQERNLRMAGPGQEGWNHACDGCCWVHEIDGIRYALRSTVTDGITIGHPCCAAVLDCKNPLPTTKHRFCIEHDHYTTRCAVTTCSEEVRPGFRTCGDPEHKKIEDHLKMRGKAMFQLKRRLERLHATQIHDSLPTQATGAVGDGIEGVGADDDEDVYFDQDGVCDEKSEKGNTQSKARFGRKWTHNEQLCVASCGVILGRATFFGSEAPNGVRWFWMKLFPTPASLPQVLWYDNNCRVMAMLENDSDPRLRDYFSNCAMPVDVFHFKSKHKESDDQCNMNCNPANWPELEASPGVWRFNSSAAEQTNVWMGGYQSIVREMSAVRYNFFLDEMIKWQNRMMVKELEGSKKAPYSIPRHVLLERNG